MGRTLDRLLRRTFKTAQFKATVNLAISRLSILKNHKQTRLSHARSDTIQLLNIDQDRALLRVEVVIKEQNMLDVFVMIEGYCHVLMERVAMIENQKLYKECPEELNEAVSCLIYAASRCGEFPELQELRSIFSVRFGKDFVARAVELRNNSGVNHKMVQKLSTRQPSREIRMKILKEIATENGITLKLHEKEEAEVVILPPTPKPDPESRKDDFIKEVDEIKPDEKTYSGSLRTRQKYADVASAAQAAFESAAYAAAAARAAVELSQSEPGSPAGSQRGNRSNSDKFSRSGLGNPVVKTPTIEYSSSELEEEELEEQKYTRKDNLQGSPSSSSSDSDGDSTEEIKPANKIVFDKSDDENEKDYYAKNKKNDTFMDNEVADNEEVQFKPLNIGRKPMSVRNRKWQAP